MNQKLGKEKVFYFSLGNPSVKLPEIVNEQLVKIINNTDSIKLYGYTSAEGDKNIRIYSRIFK